MWFVVCDEYRSGPFRTTAEAERRLAQVVAAGNCTEEHRVEAEALRSEQTTVRRIP